MAIAVRDTAAGPRNRFKTSVATDELVGYARDLQRRQRVVVGGVHEQVNGADHQRAADEGARQIASAGRGSRPPAARRCSSRHRPTAPRAWRRQSPRGRRAHLRRRPRSCPPSPEPAKCAEASRREHEGPDADAEHQGDLGDGHHERRAAAGRHRGAIEERHRSRSRRARRASVRRPRRHAAEHASDVPLLERAAQRHVHEDGEADGERRLRARPEHGECHPAEQKSGEPAECAAQVHVIAAGFRHQRGDFGIAETCPRATAVPRPPIPA